jgi:hypothetical protein
MARRTRPDPTRPPEANVDPIEKERRTLAEISDIARSIAKSIEDYVDMTRNAPDVLAACESRFDADAALAKIAETIRLNDALAAELAEKTKAATAGLSSDTEKRRQARRPAPKSRAAVTLH